MFDFDDEAENRRLVLDPVNGSVVRGEGDGD
jgi:hypothetical protein